MNTLLPERDFTVKQLYFCIDVETSLKHNLGCDFGMTLLTRVFEFVFINTHIEFEPVKKCIKMVLRIITVNLIYLLMLIMKHFVCKGNHHG